MLTIFGAGGFGREVAQWALDAGETQLQFVVDEEFLFVDELDGFQVVTTKRVSLKNSRWLIAIGDPSKRYEIVKKLGSKVSYTKLLHPTAVLGRSVTVGEGTIVGPHTVITQNISIGKHCHFGAHSLVGHDSKLGEFVTLSPMSSILGRCVVKNRVFMGAASSLRNGRTIEQDTTVGMGAVVIDNLLSGTYVGNPARRIK